MWWCQLIDWLKFETRPSSLLNQSEWPIASNIYFYPCLSACLSVCLSVCLSACLFVCLPVCLSGCQFVYLSDLEKYLIERLFLTILLSVYQSACLSVYRSVRLPGAAAVMLLCKSRNCVYYNGLTKFSFCIVICMLNSYHLFYSHFVQLRLQDS